MVPLVVIQIRQSKRCQWEWRYSRLICITHCRPLHLCSMSGSSVIQKVHRTFSRNLIGSSASIQYRHAV